MRKTMAQKHHYISGKQIAIREALNLATAANQTKKLQKQKIYAVGFPQTATEQSISSYFEQYGPVNRVLYALHPYKGHFRGFCYVIMEKANDYKQLIKMGSIDFQGTLVCLEPA